MKPMDEFFMLLDGDRKFDSELDKLVIMSGAWKLKVDLLEEEAKGPKAELEKCKKQILDILEARFVKSHTTGLVTVTTKARKKVAINSLSAFVKWALSSEKNITDEQFEALFTPKDKELKSFVEEKLESLGVSGMFFKIPGLDVSHSCTTLDVKIRKEAKDASSKVGRTRGVNSLVRHSDQE